MLLTSCGIRFALSVVILTTYLITAFIVSAAGAWLQLRRRPTATLGFRPVVAVVLIPVSQFCSFWSYGFSVARSDPKTVANSVQASVVYRDLRRARLCLGACGPGD